MTASERIREARSARKTEVRSIGRCRACKTAHKVEFAWWTPSVVCGCGTVVKLAPVQGSYCPDVKCGALCRNAVGPTCDCSCGGANHGCNH